tara:strand:+ start:3804 stop:5174 length:1371 start_codon:yes stop_codon:yes gene_type:complete
MNNKSKAQKIFKNHKIAGWGRRDFVDSKLVELLNTQEIKTFIKKTKDLQCITRGMGRSYGDAAQLKNGYIFSLNNFNNIKLSGNKVTVGGGVTISNLLKVIIPLGYFLPVSPGSAQVTIGGAIAADAHGKNHHKFGSFGNHISNLVILDGNGVIRNLTSNSKKIDNHNKFFWATIGGMGLTGVIIEATISLIKIESAFMNVDTYKCADLDSLMEIMKSKDKFYSYSVAWVDSLNKSFRGVITCAEHASKDDLNINDLDLLSYNSKNLGSAPKFLPNGILNKFTVSTFNKFWFIKSTIFKKNIQTIPQFFYPLDGISNWNRIYGINGFYQYQFVVPENKSYFISKTLSTLKRFSSNSFLTVLKRFGNSNNSFLSFPQPGWTLSVDLPASNKELLNVLNQLDEELASLGGKIYLAKDSRQSSEIFKKTYSFYLDWKRIKCEMDPNNIFQSDLSRRLKL